jgi:hypothetical protein
MQSLTKNKQLICNLRIIWRQKDGGGGGGRKAAHTNSTACDRELARVLGENIYSVSKSSFGTGDLNLHTL